MKKSTEWKQCFAEWVMFPIAVMLVATLFIMAGSEAMIREMDAREAHYCDVYGAEINNYYGEDYCYVAE